LKEAGLANGFSLQIQVQGGETNGELLASILQSAWKEIGVTVSIETLNSNSLFANTFAGKFEMQVIPTESAVNEVYNPDEPYAAYLGGELFPSNPPSEQLASLLDKAHVATSQQDRTKLWQEVQELSYAKEPSWMPVINLSALNVVSESLHNYDVLLNGHSRMEEVWLSE
jgi:peptide/nickel transport system substrate-binding protein